MTDGVLHLVKGAVESGLPDLGAPAVEHLWPFLQIFAALLFAAFTLIAGLWRGFVWLNAQIKATAQAMLSPIAETALLAKKSSRKAHGRIDLLRSELGLPPDKYEDSLETRP